MDGSEQAKCNKVGLVVNHHANNHKKTNQKEIKSVIAYRIIAVSTLFSHQRSCEKTVHSKRNLRVILHKQMHYGYLQIKET